MTMVMPHLRVEAESEARRLTAARSLTNDGDGEAVAWLEGDRPWMAVARGWRTRRALGSRIALLWRVGLEDASGATVESRLVAVSIDLIRVRREWLSRRSIERLVRQLEPEFRREIDGAVAVWQLAAEETVRSFAAAHAARCRAIVERVANRSPREFQPGLFDRRAERAQDRLADESAQTHATGAAQLAASRSYVTCARRPAQLLLVLTP